MCKLSSLSPFFLTKMDVLCSPLVSAGDGGRDAGLHNFNQTHCGIVPSCQVCQRIVHLHEMGVHSCHLLLDRNHLSLLGRHHGLQGCHLAFQCSHPCLQIAIDLQQPTHLGLESLEMLLEVSRGRDTGEKQHKRPHHIDSDAQFPH